MSLSVKEETRLKKIAKQNNVEFTVVVGMYKEELGNLKEQGITENIDRFAVHAVLNHFRREKQRQAKPVAGRQKAEVLYGIVTGDMGMRDKAQEMREAVKRYINKNGRQAAQDAQLIDGDGNILDSRAQIFGKENPDHLEPLNPNLKLRSRVIFAFLRHNGDKDFKFATIQTNSNQLAIAWKDVRGYTPCQTFGLIKEETKSEMKVNSSEAKDTLSVFKGLKEEYKVDEIVLGTLERNKMLTKIQNVDKHYEAFKDAWDHKIFVRGVVSWINTRPDNFGQLSFGLMDPDDEEAVVTVKVPKHVPMDFGELSEVVVCPGRTRRGKYKDQETGELTDGDVFITAYGIFAIPGLCTPKERESTGLEEEEQIEGWIS